jgi:hypothetical protein
VSATRCTSEVPVYTLSPVEGDRALHTCMTPIGRRREYCHNKVAGDSVERLHLVAIGVNEQHAVVKERRAFVRAVGQATSSMPVRSSATFCFVTCRKGLKPHAVRAATPRQPLACRRIGEKRIGHRREAVQRICFSWRRRKRHPAGEAAAWSPRRSRATTFLSSLQDSTTRACLPRQAGSAT